MIDIKNIFSIEKKIESLEDSINYINSRLQSYYNTEQERYDIERNIIHAELMLSSKEILETLNQDAIDTYHNTLHLARSRIGI